MVYRILYSDDGQNHPAEAMVEAHNTAEALVKFRHAGGACEPARVGRSQVISICAEPAEETATDPADLWAESPAPGEPPSFCPRA